MSEIRDLEVVEQVNQLLAQGWVLVETYVNRRLIPEDDQTYLRESPRYCLGKPRESQ